MQNRFAGFLLCLILLMGAVQALAAGQGGLQIVNVGIEQDRVNALIYTNESEFVNSTDFGMTLGSEALTNVKLQPLEKAGEGTSYYFVLDVSKSYTGAMKRIKGVIANMIAEMDENDNAVVLDTNDASADLKLTPDKEKLTTQLETAGGRKYLYDTLSRLCKEAQSDKTRKSRSCVVVFTAAKDEKSQIRSLNEIIESYKDSNITVYTVSVAMTNGSGTIINATEAKNFGELARATKGGQAYTVGVTQEQGSTYNQIEQQITQNEKRFYRLSGKIDQYYMPENDTNLTIVQNTETNEYTANYVVPMFVLSNLVIAETIVPTEVPTAMPTAVPTNTPTAAPTAVPTNTPTATPTTAPTNTPTATPTSAPTIMPTTKPTEAPPEPDPIIETRIVLIVAICVIAIIVLLAILSGRKKKAERIRKDREQEEDLSKEETKGMVHQNNLMVQIVDEKREQMYEHEMSTELMVGRAARLADNQQKNKINIENDSTISEYHFKLYWEKGMMFIEDQNSTNGTALKNGGKIQPLIKVPLHQNDVICIGDTELLICWRDL